VTVHGWDKPEVSYNATKKAETEEGLKQIHDSRANSRDRSSPSTQRILTSTTEW
jgi:hypothetical protein